MPAFTARVDYGARRTAAGAGGGAGEGFRVPGRRGRTGRVPGRRWGEKRGRRTGRAAVNPAAVCLLFTSLGVVFIISTSESSSRGVAGRRESIPRRPEKRLRHGRVPARFDPLRRGRHHRRGQTRQTHHRHLAPFSGHSSGTSTAATAPPAPPYKPTRICDNDALQSMDNVFASAPSASHLACVALMRTFNSAVSFCKFASQPAPAARTPGRCRPSEHPSARAPRPSPRSCPDGR